MINLRKNINLRFRSITQSYYRSAHALILVYDVTNQPTFDCCPDWLREIEEYASPKVLRVLVGNKIDRDDHEIPGDVGEEFANRHGMYFLQVRPVGNLCHKQTHKHF